jgi:hypothetical protein
MIVTLCNCPHQRTEAAQKPDFFEQQRDPPRQTLLKSAEQQQLRQHQVDADAL